MQMESIHTTTVCQADLLAIRREYKFGDTGNGAPLMMISFIRGGLPHAWEMATYDGAHWSVAWIMSHWIGNPGKPGCGRSLRSRIPSLSSMGWCVKLPVGGPNQR